MAKLVFGIAGLSGSGKSNLIDCFSKKFGGDLKVVKLEDLMSELFKFGGEGHRQISNYFGGDFLRKSGELNVNKLWKFVYSDHHKLRILDFLLEPLMLNLVQQLVDSFPGMLIIENINFKIDGWKKILTKVILVVNTDEKKLVNLSSKVSLPVSPEKYMDVQSRLYSNTESTEYYLFNNLDPGQLENSFIELCSALSI